MVTVFWNMVLRKMSVPNRAEIREDWRKLQNEELHDLYCSPTIIQVIKSRMTEWVGHVACMGHKRSDTGFDVETCRKETTWKIYALMGEQRLD
jgi:hypothetical protein